MQEDSPHPAQIANDELLPVGAFNSRQTSALPHDVHLVPFNSANIVEISEIAFVFTLIQESERPPFQRFAS